MEKIYSMCNMEGYMTRYLANLRLGTPTHLYRVAKKNRTFAIFRAIFCQKKFFLIFSKWPFGGFFYARNRLRALKNLENASLAMKSLKIWKKMKNSDFFNDFMVKEAFWRFFNARKRFLA